MSEEEATQTPQEETAAASYTAPEPLISREVKDVIDLQKFMGTGEKKEKLSIVELILLQDWLDRREERQLRRSSQPMKPEEIAKTISNAVTEAVKPLVETTKKGDDEKKPKWAEALEKQVQSLLEKTSKEEEEKRMQEIIEKTQHPLLDQIKERDLMIEKLNEKIKQLEEKYENIGTSEGGGKDKLDVYLEMDEKLEQAIQKRRPKPGTVYLSEGEGPIPVEGELPAWVVYGPIVAERIIRAVERGINNVASRIIEGTEQPPPQPMPERKELIKLPPKPSVGPPKEEAPKEEKPEGEAEKTEEELSKMPELIKIPEKPRRTEETYTKEDLEKKKMTELWSIAKKLGISKKGKKNELINRILEAEKKNERETSS